MNSYESLVDECSKNGITIIEKKFKSSAKGLWKNNKIGISADIETNSEKLCVLAEERGHYLTSSGNITDLSNTCNKKQELIARNYAYDLLCSVEKLILAFVNGASNEYEIAEYIEITPKFLRNAVKHHKEKHGLSFVYKGYTIYFEPCLRIVRN